MLPKLAAVAALIGSSYAIAPSRIQEKLLAQASVAVESTAQDVVVPQCRAGQCNKPCGLKCAQPETTTYNPDNSLVEHFGVEFPNKYQCTKLP